MENVNELELIAAARPNLKESSVKQYKAHLVKLKKLYDTDNYEFLKSPDDLMEKLKDNHFTSQRNTLNAVIVLLMALNSEKEYDDLIKIYSDMRDEFNKQYEKQQESGVISQKQKDNFVSVKEIEEMLAKMNLHITKNKLKKKEKLSILDHNHFNAWMIFNFLLRIPTRNDMAGQILLTRGQFNKLTDEDKKDHNYLVKEKSGFSAYYNDYKTESSYGEKKIEITKDLSRIFNVFIKVMKIKNGEPLFVSTQGNALSRNQISQLLLKSSKEWIGKNISSTMLRKIVASDQFGELSELGQLKKKQEELAHNMGHSVNVQNKVYLKTAA
tara:strand:+ start:423 stop:1403 length:981 start_codon:yes stop_codon:yes gene_type:complete